MGVPALFRWLSRKYPKIITPVLEEDPTLVNGVKIPPAYSNPNPNGELDNLYLDMNGIVHPCSHPENKPPPETEDEMLLAVFEYTDRVVNMARPRKILMIAVDGVAPRAKMNQQRARRFRSARDAKIANEEREKLITAKEDYGEVIDESIKSKKTWDSNAITPGTPFMDKLALALRYWTAYKLATDPGWENLQIIISDATVPGEGEHKIMNFIRSQRSDIEYDPNIRHAIYGLDADLIFLGLATHEPHFRVLREDVFAQDQRSLSLHEQMNMTEETRALLKEQEDKKPFLWLNINVLREYLQVELNVPRLPFKFDLERAIDDWVFLCFFCGNDFLPHLPSLDVRNDSINLLVSIWKYSLPKMKTYITCDGKLDLENVEILLSALGPREINIFRDRHANEQRRNERYRPKRRNESKLNQTQLKSLGSIPVFDVNANSNVSNKKLFELRDLITLANSGDANAAQELKSKLSEGSSGDSTPDVSEVDSSDTVVASANIANISAAAALKEKLAQQTAVSSNDASIGDKRRAPESVPESLDEEDGDPVRLWEPGFRERYYTVKFHITKDEVNEVAREVVKSYIEGISWVLLYYYQGCPSWDWYYPYHYAPFAADFQDLKDIDIKFKQGEPFLPFEQLMSVLPAASGHNLPDIFRPLMSEPDSPIIDFYPEEFPIDMNGAKMSWQGIVLLPFIDEKRLLSVVRDQYVKLSDAEKSRNVRKEEILFISNKNANYERFKKLYSSDDVKVIDFHFHKSGLAGTVSKNLKFEFNQFLNCPIEGDHSFPNISTELFLKLNYRMPPKQTGKSIILTGYIKHLPVLTQEDKDSIIYSNGNGRYRKFQTSDQNIIKVGPNGPYCYSPRYGGYKSFLLMFQQQQHNIQVQNNNKILMQGGSLPRPTNSSRLPAPSRYGYLKR